jgi:hypothetical protein
MGALNTVVCILLLLAVRYKYCLIFFTLAHFKVAFRYMSARPFHQSCRINVRLLCTTAPQPGRSLVRFSKLSLDFFIDIIFPAALWPWG